MKQIVIAANWKMNTTLDEARKLVTDLKKNLNTSGNVITILCPPFVYLSEIQSLLVNSNIHIGAQNIYFEEKGAFTGEISASMVSDFCEFVILGHSERRSIFGESNELINKKIHATLQNGLKPILCVGESQQQREDGLAEQIIQEQLSIGLNGVNRIDNIQIAYEPVWAIGTGIAATPVIANEIMGGIIKSTLLAMYDEKQMNTVPLLYGGSVNSENIEDYVSMSGINGALIGGASLKVKEFTSIVQKAESVIH